MSKRTVYNEVVAKIEETDLSVSVAKQLYIKTLRGNLEVGSIHVNTYAELYDSITSLPYVVQPSYKDFISRYITAIIYQSLTKAGYNNPESIINTGDFKQELHEVLLAADFDCKVYFYATIYYHILPVELGHHQPVSLFYQRFQDEDGFQVEGISYSVPSDSRYYLTPEMIGEFQAVMTLYNTLDNALTSGVEPCSITIDLHYWSKGIHFLDDILWDGLFSYNTESIYTWLLTIPEFIQ